MPTPHIETFILGDYQTNCFVVTPKSDSQAGDPCWVFDCGFQPEALLDYIESRGLEAQAIYLTHAHVDHIAGLDIARSRLGDIPVFGHPLEKDWCENPMLNLSMFSGQPIAVAPPAEMFQPGQSLDLAGETWRILHTPGHSPGSVIFIHDESKQAIVGDTLFQDSIGRIDFPTSNPDDMRRTIRETMMSLPDELTIHPGHGPSTTIGRERTHNPFVVQGF